MSEISNKWNSSLANNLLTYDYSTKDCYVSNSGKYTYYGNSLAGKHYERFARVVKIALIILVTLTVVGAAIIALADGYGYTCKWIRELYHDIEIETRTFNNLEESDAAKEFSGLINEYLTNHFGTRTFLPYDFYETIKQLDVDTLNRACRLLEIYSSTLNEEEVDEKTDLIVFSRLGDGYMGMKTELTNSIYQIHNKRFKKMFADVMLFCEQQVIPFTQYFDMVIATEENSPAEFDRHTKSIQSQIPLLKTDMEALMAKKGYFRPFPYINIAEKGKLKESKQADRFILEMNTYANRVKKKESIYVDLRPFRPNEDIQLTKEQQLKLLGYFRKSKVIDFINTEQQLLLAETSNRLGIAFQHAKRELYRRLP